MSCPPGSEIWKEAGGWAALTDTQFATVQNSFGVSMQLWASGDAKKSTQPKEPKPPIGRIKERQTGVKKEKEFVSKSQNFIERFGGIDTEEMNDRLSAWGDDWKTAPAKKRHQDSAQRLLAWQTEAAEAHKE